MEPVAEARAGDRDLLCIRRDPFCLVSRSHESVESRAEADSDFQDPARRRRKSRQENVRGALLRSLNRLPFPFQEAVVKIGDVPLFRNKGVGEHVQRKQKVPVEVASERGTAHILLLSFWTASRISSGRGLMPITVGSLAR